MSKKHKRFAEWYGVAPTWGIESSCRSECSLGRIYVSKSGCINVNDMIQLLERIQKQYGNLPVDIQLEWFGDETVPIKTLQVDKKPKYGHEPRQADAIILSKNAVDDAWMHRMTMTYGFNVWDDTWMGMDVGKGSDQTGKIDIFEELLKTRGCKEK